MKRVPPHPPSNTTAPHRPLPRVSSLPPHASVSPTPQRTVTKGPPQTQPVAPAAPNWAVPMAGSWHGCHRPPIRMPFGRAALAGEEPAPAAIVIFPSSVANAGARRAAQPKPKHFSPPWGSSGNTRCRDKTWGGDIPSHSRGRKETTRISPQIMAQTWSRLLNPSCHLFRFFFPPPSAILQFSAQS